MSKPGQDFVGIGVGAMVFNSAGEVFLARRGPEATNEADTWEFPGGALEYGERLEDAVSRELFEEYGIRIAVRRQLGAFDHILKQEGQHWVSVTFVAEHSGGEPVIREPLKCTAIGWHDLSQLPQPLSRISRENLAAYLRHPDPGGPAHGSSVAAATLR